MQKHLTKPLSERFWKFVKKTDNCWEWSGALTRGYGSMGSNSYAHRISWEIHNGPIPKGLWVLHKCDNPSCSNPDHLFLGTQTDNMRDMLNKGRGNCFGVGNKLTPEQIKEIRSTYRFGSLTNGARALAKRFKIDRKMIANIINKEAWKHVT
jgi:hypothetical protein